MSEHLESKLDRLEELLQANVSPAPAEQAIVKSGKYLKWLQTIIAIIVVVVGMGVTWGMTQGKATAQASEISNLKEVTEGNRKDIVEIQIEQAPIKKSLVDIQRVQVEMKQDMKNDLNNLKNDIKDEMKELKKLLRGR